MSDLIRNTQKAIVKSDGGTTKAVGGGLAVMGGGTLGVYLLAGLIPFVGPFALAVFATLLGLFLLLK